jgi:hypothetical protein
MIEPSQQYLEGIIALVAGIVHENNRAYCEAIGDNSQLPWGEAPEWQRLSALRGVAFILNNPDAGPGASHRSWLAEKEADGWVFGEVKDADAKTHPCMVPFEELPLEQQVKDHLFVGMVRTLAQLL